jgi:uncharacterized protein (TIGR02600 family)
VKPTFPLFQHRSRPSRRGIALISVLAMVVLLTALVVAFMLRAGSERQSSGFYKAETGSRALADTAINLVQAQINDATSQGLAVSWASQPGAIRTFNNSGNLLNIYRLYSNPAMRTGTVTDLANDIPSVNWLNQPAVWVDLNAPVNNDPNQAPINTHFPILDPRDPSNLAHDLSDGAGGTTMDGFAITSAAPIYSYANNIDTNLNKDPAPMPVQWLYVLQDGSIIPPDSGGGTAVLFTNAPAGHAPSATNPIVGRVAFWTDDETCKVNINTAGGDGKMVTTGGKADPTDIANKSFWSPPYFNTTDDNGLGAAASQTASGVAGTGFNTAQPASGEYQRYPGHPATVALNEVLSSLLYGTSGTSSIPSAQFYGAVNGTTYTGITPRYAFGGSQGGSVITATGSTGINTVSARLYPSVGELLFNPDGTSTTPRTATVLNTTATDSTSGTTRQRAETARFFLTAHSRAPELNLFGLPRVCIWPVSSVSTNWSPVDQLLVFCSTIGGNAYYFVRNMATGAANSFGTNSDINFARNQALMSYLDMLTQQNIPGFGGNFASKNYGTGGHPLQGSPTNPTQSRQILTEIFDYIRTIDLDDASFNTPSTGAEGAGAYGGKYWYTGLGTNQIAPTVLNGVSVGSSSNLWKTQGLAAYPRLYEVSLHFIAMGQGGKPGSAGPPIVSPIAAVPVSPSPVSAFSASYLGAGDNSTTLTYAYSGTGGLYSAQLPTPGGGGQYVPPGTYTGSGTSQVFISAPATAPVPAGYNKVYPTLNNQTGLSSGIPPDGTTAVQAFLYLSFVNPAQSWVSTPPSVFVTVSGLSAFMLQSAGSPTSYSLNFPTSASTIFENGGGWVGGAMAGYNDFLSLMHGYSRTATVCQPFFSSIIPLTTANSMNLSAGPVTVTVYDGACGSGVTPTTSNCKVIQTYTVNFPLSSNFPMPTLVPLKVGYLRPPPPPPLLTLTETTGPIYGTGDPGTYAIGKSPWPDCLKLDTTTANPASLALDTARAIGDNWNPAYDRLSMLPHYNGGACYIGPGDVIQSMVLSGPFSDPRVLAVNGSLLSSTAFAKHPNWGLPPVQFAHSLFVGDVSVLPGNGPTTVFDYMDYTNSHIQSCLGTLAGNDTTKATVPPVAPTIFTTPGGVPAIAQTASLQANGGSGDQAGVPPDWDNGMSSVSDGPWTNKADEGCSDTGGNYTNYFSLPNVAYGGTFSANREVPSPGMFGSLPTGVDPLGLNPAGWQTLLFRPGPYAGLGNGTTGTWYHPGMGTYGTTYALSPPYTSPPDHLWLDLFWMPEAEPYAISEPFSTGGKVNLNYEIVPFTYIKRATALRAAMATEKIGENSLANAANSYKVYQTTPVARRPIDLDVTIAQFEDKFNGTNNSGTNPSTIPDIFRSASQICEEYLVPLQISALPYSDTKTYAALSAASEPWEGNGASIFASDWYQAVVPVLNGTGTLTSAPFAMVGDNVRERPYTDLYAKVTTKSNTYTVYYRVQTLKSTPSLPSSWDETKGAITGEYRGSTTLERYIDPTKLDSSGTKSDYPDYATGALPPANLEGYYQWRVVENRQFTP